MAKRIISFEIDEEAEGHLLALAKDWEKEPIDLAKAFFIEELKANTAGSRGIPLLRRYLYRDADVYFTPEELAERSRKNEEYWRSPEGQAIQRESKLDLERLRKVTAKENEKGKLA